MPVALITSQGQVQYFQVIAHASEEIMDQVNEAVLLSHS